MVFLKKSSRRRRGFRSSRRRVTVKAVLPRRRGHAIVPMRSLPASVRPETKFYDTSTNNTAISTLASAGWFGGFPMRGIGNSASQEGRVGQNIFVTRLNVRMLFYGSSDVGGCWVRVLLVRDNKVNTSTAATAPLLSDMLLSLGGDTERDLMSLMQRTNGGRFKIVKQKYFFMPTLLAAANVASPTTYISNSIARHIQWDVKINRRIEYEDTHNAPCSGCEYSLWAISNLTSNEPRIVTAFRVYYTDA